MFRKINFSLKSNDYFLSNQTTHDNNMLNIKETFILGFALFAMFFGAGNLVFPVFLGQNTGEQWYIACAGFLITGVGLPFLGLLSAVKNPDFSTFALPVSRNFNIIYCTILMLLVGPMFVVPRMGALTYELAVQPLLNNDSFINHFLTSFIFYFITYIMTLKVNNIADILGKFLTPIIIGIILLVFIIGAQKEFPELSENIQIKHVFLYGITSGYYTIDVLLSILFGTMIVNLLKSRGIEGEKKLYLIFASIIAVLCLGAIYIGLSYYGAQISRQNITSTSHGVLHLFQYILGGKGSLLFGLCISLACISTAVGLINLSADWFSKYNLLSYKQLVLVISAAALFLSLNNFDLLIKIFEPFIMMIYPVTIALIIMNMFGLPHKYYKIFTYLILVLSVIQFYI